jgi:osmotically-inducible protein OsmY
MKISVSDSLLRNQICEALDQFDEEDFSNLRVEVIENDVLIRGSVLSLKARRRSEELIRKIRGVRSVVDESKIKLE